MAKIEGLTKLAEQLRARAAAATKDSDVSVVVGFTAAYALYVHENLQAHHDVGQAKFLEQPARQLNGDGTLGRMIADALRQKKTMAQALLLAGLRLQRESMKLCPVDTGALKNSAFTRLDKGGGPDMSQNANVGQGATP